MTDRKETREILLNEFVLAGGIALGAAALGAGIASAVKSKRIEKRIANPSATPKNAGLLGRVGQNVKNLGRMYLNKVQTDASEKLAKMASAAHNEIAQKYMLKPQEYASAMVGHSRKQAVVNRLKSSGLTNDPNLTNVGMQDIDDYISHRASGSAAAFTPRTLVGNDNVAISDYISTPSRIEALDLVNPAARQFREKMSRESKIPGVSGILSPKSTAIRNRALNQINDRKLYMSKIRDAVRTDREEQIQQSAAKRNASVANLNSQLTTYRNNLPWTMTTGQMLKAIGTVSLLKGKNAIANLKGLAGTKPLDVWNKR